MNRLTIAIFLALAVPLGHGLRAGPRQLRRRADGGRPRAMKRAIACGAALAAFALPGAAHAATLNELPFQALPDRDAAGCLRPTGVPGGLALFGRPGSSDLWRADAGGLVRGERARLGRHFQCAAVAEAGGAAVAAALVGSERRYAVRAVARDPGGAYGPPVTVSTGPQPRDVSAAVSPNGHAVVAWTEARGELSDLRQRVRVVVARRLPGRAFAAPEAVTGWWATNAFGEPDPEVGIDAGGTASVVWSRGDRRGFAQTAIVAVAAPGAGFAQQRLARGSDYGQGTAIAVAPDGWSVIAQAVDGSGLEVFERPPGSPRFAHVPAAARGDAYVSVEHPSVAVADGGGAVVAWRTEPAGEGRGVAAITRAPGGAFTEPQVIVPAREPSSGHAFAVLIAGGSPPFDLETERPRAVIGPGGRVLLAWTGLRGRLATYRARIATGRLGSGFDAPQDVSRSVRDADAVAPLFLPDGRAAVAWVDNASGNRDGRLHLAVEGASGPPSSAPQLTLRYARIQRLFPSQPVRVVATCDRPCDVTGAIRGDEDVTVTQLAAGSVVLELPRSSQFDPPHFRFGAMRVDVLAAEPGGTAIARESVRVRAVRRPPPPLLRPLDVRARRRGDRIVVSWRTAGPARRMQFSAFGQRTRNPRTIEISAADLLAGRGRTRFTARLRPDRPARVRWVTVHAASLDRQGARSVTVRVG